MRRARKTAALAVAAGMLASLAVGRPAQASHTSVGVPSPYDGRAIWITIYKPASASSTNKAPVVLHSHGWGGSRTSGEGAFSSWLNAGMGVVSIDQRGHGATGGTAHVENPDIEGQDIIGVINYIAGLDWVKKDLDGQGNPIANDPVMAAIGGSYGGGYQLITAFTEVRDFGKTRFNALAPEITWNNLSRSLGPSDVPRTLWDTALYAAGATRLPDYVHQSFALGLATATFPNGEIPGTYNLKDRFYRNSPAWFADNGMLLDIPVIYRQGTSDNLFLLNEAWHNFEDTLTPAARAKSLIIGYNGGHVLPAVLPTGTASGSDACSTGGFESLSRNFFATAFAGGNPAALLPKQYNVTSATGQCIRADSFSNYTAYPVGTVAAPTGAAGAPLNFAIAQGPLTVAGIAKLRGKLTSTTPDARAYFALSVGTNAATAQVLQGNVAPHRQLLPVIDGNFDFELPGVGANIAANQTLYLTISTISDMFAGTTRSPGAMVITDAVVDVPLA